MDIFRAICLWEGRGKIDCDAIGKAGEVGPAQILKDYMADANQQLKLDGFQTLSLADMKNYDKAKQAFEAYCWKYWAFTDEAKARLHHRGPNKKRQYDRYGDAYWKGVQKYLMSDSD